LFSGRKGKKRRKLSHTRQAISEVRRPRAQQHEIMESWDNYLDSAPTTPQPRIALVDLTEDNTPPVVAEVTGGERVGVVEEEDTGEGRKGEKEDGWEEKKRVADWIMSGVEEICAEQENRARLCDAEVLNILREDNARLERAFGSALAKMDDERAGGISRISLWD
jgi:hypothetical protein